jgi:hypothetical protein
VLIDDATAAQFSVLNVTAISAHHVKDSLVLLSYESKIADLFSALIF